MGRHREQQTRARYGRMAVLGGTGIMPSAATGHPAAAARASHLIAASTPTSATTRGPQGPDRAADGPACAVVSTPRPANAATADTVTEVANATIRP